MRQNRSPFGVDSKDEGVEPVMASPMLMNARLNTNFQTYPRTMPPMRLGMKNPARKIFCPFTPLIATQAKVKAATQ